MVEANKPTLVVAGGGVIAVIVVAVLVGAALSQPDAPVVGDDSTPTPQVATDLPTLEPTPNETGTDTGGSAGETDTPTPYPTLTPTPTATPTPTVTPAVTEVPAESFDEREIERLVAQYINERRAAANLSRLSTNGGAVDELTSMARGHSVEMANVGEAIHRIDGETSAERYTSNDLYQRCRWSSEDGNTLVTADDNALEAVGHTVAGKPYYLDGDRRFNGNESAVAQAIVDGWWETGTYRPRLRRPKADSVGVGVDITRRGDVYVTADFC